MAKGHIIAITRRGKIVGKLVPPGPAPSKKPFKMPDFSTVDRLQGELARAVTSSSRWSAKPAYDPLQDSLRNRVRNGRVGPAHVEARFTSTGALEVHNPTAFPASVRGWVEDAATAARPLDPFWFRHARVIALAPGARQSFSLG